MKSRFTGGVLVLLAVALLSVNFAWSQSVTVSSPGTPTVYGAFSVDVSFSDLSNLGSSHIVATFDPTKMQYSSVTNGNVFTDSPPVVNAETGQITVDQAMTAGAYGSTSGTLFTINFTAIGTGTSDIAVPTVTFRDPTNAAIGPTSGTTRSVTINNPTPSTTSISPTSMTADHGVVTLTVNGDNFLTGSVVKIGGVDHALKSFVSKTEVTAEVLATELKTATTYGVTVVNATPGGGESNSQSLSVTAGAAANLAKTSGDAQSAVTKSVLSPFVVTVTDANSNPVSGTSVSFEILSAPGSSSGQSISTASATTGTDGKASTTLTLGNKSGTYTVRATSSGLTGSPADFSANALPGTATQLVFGQQPTNAGTGAAISPAVTVRILDADGNLTDDTRDVTLAFGNNPGGGALGGTLTKAATGGTATFSDLSIVKAGTGYTLAASANTLTGATSDAFSITAGQAAKLVLTSGDPQSGTVGTALANPFVVMVTDANDNPVQGANVTFAIGTVPTDAAGQSLSNAQPVVTGTDGQASTTLTLGNIPGAYTVTATSGLLSGSPATFHATAEIGAASRLTFGVQPVNTASVTTITPAVTVRIEDASGNLVTTGSYNVTLAIGNNPAGGVLGGTTTVAAVSGVATFSTLSIDKAGTGYTLAATSSPVLTGTTSSAFNITVGTPTKLTFGVQPENTAAGSYITPAVTVRIEDGGGNLTSDTRPVTLAFGNNAGSGTLSGTLTKNAVAGLATFDDLSINKVGTGYTLAATSNPSLTATTSNAFNITSGAFDHLVFSPVSTPQVSGTPFTITVTALDVNLNTVTSYVPTVTLSATGGTISPTSGQYAAGVLTLPVSIVVAVPGSCTITVTDALTHSATSNSFSVGAAPKLFLSVNASDTTKRVEYPHDSWSATTYESSDWSIKTKPVVSFYIVPEASLSFASYDVTLSWVNTELHYLRTVEGGLAGTHYDTLAGASQVRIQNSKASGNWTMSPGQYIAKVEFELLKPGRSTAHVANAVFSRSGVGPFVVTPHDAVVKAYLGDVTSSASDTTGDGRVDFADLSPWSISYWSGVPGHGGPSHYKVKYDVGPTGDGYVYSMPAVDGQIEFEDLIIFSISYGLTNNGIYSKISVPVDTVQVSLGQPIVIGNETRIPVMLAGGFSDVRAMSLVVDGRFGKFLGAEKGSSLQGYQTPVMIMSRATERQAFVDLSVVGSDVQALSRPGDAVILRFEGTPQIQLTKNVARNSYNMALPVQKIRGAGEAVPTTYQLLQNYPNPFNPSTTIEYQLPAETMTNIEVYNMLGERVATLVHEVQPAGFYSIKWNGARDTGARVATGVYFYRMQADKFSVVKKMLLMK